jgi:hypothetical protein
LTAVEPVAVFQGVIVVWLPRRAGASLETDIISAIAERQGPTRSRGAVTAGAVDCPEMMDDDVAGFGFERHNVELFGMVLDGA